MNTEKKHDSNNSPKLRSRVRAGEMGAVRTAGMRDAATLEQSYVGQIVEKVDIT
jgi:hypothetical protein